MLPPKRLEYLLSQAIEYQQEQCTYHVKPGKLSLEDVTLLEDHACTKQTLPCVTIQILTDHTDEVWFCKFSPDGNKLATGSKDGNLLIYDLDLDKYQLTLRKQFNGHTFGIGCIAWCPHSRYIIACGTDDCNEVWIWDIEVRKDQFRLVERIDCLLIFRKANNEQELIIHLMIV